MIEDPDPDLDPGNTGMLKTTIFQIQICVFSLILALKSIVVLLTVPVF
jgi:hypothetical protein